MTIERFIPIGQRNSQIEKKLSYLGIEVRNFLEGNSQPDELRSDIIRIATTGVWGKLNAMNPNFEPDLNDLNKPLVFTGQQPTIDYGLYRRISKRSGIHPDLVTVHTHADHDRAGKNGFSSISLPVVVDGALSYKKYNIGSEYGDEALMSEIKCPSAGEIEQFFGEITSDAKTVGIAQADTEIMEECKNFVLENINDIRSLAEFNGVVQTFLVRKLSPDINTVDIMLSDLLKTRTARAALAQIVLEMPEWIKKYNKAAEHVNSIPQPDGHLLPQPLREIEKDKGFFIFKNKELLFELPLWIVPNGKRERAWMRVDKRAAHIGTYDSKKDKFDIRISFNPKTTVEDLLANPNFAAVSPGAVTLVDILRKKLKLAVIHGKTGHYYEAINELSEVADEQPLPEGLLANPDSLPSMAPVSSASLPARTSREERVFINRNLETLAEEKKSLEASFSDLNTGLGQSFRNCSEALQKALGRPEVELNKAASLRSLEDGHPLIGIAEEFDRLEAFLQENPNLGAIFPRTKKPHIAIQNLYDVYKSLGEVNFQKLLSENNFSVTQKLWSALEKWVILNNERAEINVQKEQIHTKIAETDNQISSLDQSKKRDIPLVQAALYKPELVERVRKINASKIIYNSPDGNSG